MLDVLQVASKPNAVLLKHERESRVIVM